MYRIPGSYIEYKVYDPMSRCTKETPIVANNIVVPILLTTPPK